MYTYVYIQRERSPFFLIVQLKSLQSNSKIFINLNLLLKKYNNNNNKIKIALKILNFFPFLGAYATLSLLLCALSSVALFLWGCYCELSASESCARRNMMVVFMAPSSLL